MLRRLHNSIFALRLRQVFTESPLVLVYQTLGHVDPRGVRDSLAASVAAQLPDANIGLDLCHMKNTMAAASGDDTLGRLFNNSNLLVGFQFNAMRQQLGLGADPGQKPGVTDHLGQQHASSGQEQPGVGLSGGVGWRQQRVTRSTPPSAIVGALLERPMPGPHLPQEQLRALVEMGVRLPSEQPLVLVGAFVKRAATPLAYLKRWIKLDTHQVYGELLGALESPAEELLCFEGSAEALLDALEDPPSDVALVLDHQAATAGAAAAAAAAPLGGSSREGPSS